MLRPASISAASFAAMVLAGCASTPEPCTAEWVDYQFREVTRPFVAEYRSEIRTLRDLTGDLENPDILTAFRLAGQADNIILMVEDFRDDVVPRIQNAVAQCEEPRLATQLLVDVLEREGVEHDVIRWVEALGVLMDDA